MKKYTKILLTLCLLFSLFACNKSDDSKYPTTINFGYLRVPNDETIAIAQKYIDDYFSEKNIKVNYIIVDSGVEANKAFASKSLDFASMGNTNGIVALASNLDTELVWIHEVLGTNEGLVVRKDSGIKKIEDLKGKKIATPFAATSHYMLMKVLQEAGIEKDVTLLDMTTIDIVAAYLRGDIDAAYSWEPTLSEMKKADGEFLVTSADMLKKGYITANVGLARKSFAQKYPELITGLLLQLSKANDLYRNDSDTAIKIVSDSLEISKDFAKKQMEGSIWLSLEELLSPYYMGTKENPGNFSKVMKDTSDFLETQGSIQKSPSQEAFDEFINPSYAQEVLKLKSDN